MTHADNSDWVLEKEEQDIQLKIYTREVSGSSLREFKGVMIAETNLTTLAALLLDSNAAPQWMHQCEKFEIIEQIDPLNAVIYFVNGAPWPVSDRDAVISSSMLQDPETLTLQVSVDAITGRLPKDDDYVRIPRMTGSWTFNPLAGGKVEIIYQAHVEPGGSLPAWLANSVVVETPYHTMSNMLDMIKLTKYQQTDIPLIKNGPNN
ncbi:hypothetical protein A9R00_03840 [Oleispira antarctica]|uniref:START domain-containing protein n=1 Tax=Oleispira antarctica TaxID=188908 RepID=A0A1Y5HU77_OLEAN|nr:hypothetical protein A9R00_03840 [Oleispira antarctica]